ncbi:glycosyltransferase family 4 protein [Kitasatospora sp. NPDC092948]|uniref:glycosyltransferase family 4 protein n=1 Tax=Kitasatospora sp. NPDC092948 TaxID=3364088 RepID=UPI0037FA80DD
MSTILQVTPYYPPHLGGLERVVEQLAQRLAARHDVRVVTTVLGAGDEPRRQAEGRLAVRRHRAVELAHTALAPGLPLALLRAPRGALAHVHCAHALIPETVALVAALRRQPFVLHFHLDVDASGPLGRLLRPYKRHVFARVMRAAAAVIVLTEAQREFVRTAYRVPDGRIHVIPNGVAERWFRPTAAPRPDGPLRVLFVGRLNVQKRADRLLEAVALTREPVQVRLAGDGELRAELTARAAALGLRDVEFTGALDAERLSDAHGWADVFVLPSDKEGMPLAALEAMAAALPVIATDVPGNRELVDGTGLLVDPEPAALAAALDRVAADRQLRAELAARSARTAAGHTWESVTARVEEVYASVRAGSGR